LIIGILSGAPYQISGPTGAMSAVLIIIAQRVGIEGVWMTGLIAGVIILAIGLLRMGRFVAFIPSSVITGFTSGIAFIIFVGQIDNFLGVSTEGAESAGLKFLGYLRGGFTPEWTTILIGLLVVAIMIFWPARFNRYVPGSLIGIIVATLVAVVTQWPVANIGEIPRTILLDQRLTFATIPWDRVDELIVPALSVAALGAVESLLCGAVGSKMTGVRLQANQELIAQGVGNIIIPFFGGVPATAAIARSSVGIKSGGQTRMVSIIHALALLAAALLAAPIIALVPLTALAGVLMVTAVRMNEWDAIGFMFSHRFKTGIAHVSDHLSRHDYPRPDPGDHHRRHHFRWHLHQPGGESGDRHSRRRCRADAGARHGSQNRLQIYPRGVSHRPALLCRDQHLQRGLRERGRCRNVDSVDARRAVDRPVWHRGAALAARYVGGAGQDAHVGGHAPEGDAYARTRRSGRDHRQGKLFLERRPRHPRR
jgi:hypothetical protein